jgi:hypothetical protein
MSEKQLADQLDQVNPRLAQGHIALDQIAATCAASLQLSARQSGNPQPYPNIRTRAFPLQA